jgi:hypothetical protein
MELVYLPWHLHSLGGHRRTILAVAANQHREEVRRPVRTAEERGYWVQRDGESVVANDARLSQQLLRLTMLEVEQFPNTPGL